MFRVNYNTLFIFVFLFTQFSFSEEKNKTLPEHIEELYRESKEFTDNIELHVVLVKALKSAHRFEEAKDILLKFQEKFPENTIIKQELSETLYILDKSNMKALHLAEECVEKYPDSKNYLEYFGHLQQQFGFHEEAVETLEKLNALEPENEMYRYQLASALHFSGQDEKAIELLDDLVKDAPKPYVLALAGRVHQSVGHTDKAERYLQHSLELDSKNELAAEELGKIYLAQNQSEKAVKYLTLAVDHNPFSIRAATKLSEALFRNKQRQAAQQILKRVERLRSYSEQRRYQLHHLFEHGAVKLEEHRLLASEFFALGLPQKAEPHLETIVELKPADTDAAYSLASIKFRNRKFEETLPLLQMLQKSKHAETDYYQAMMVICLAKTGQIAKASATFSAAKKMYPDSTNIKDAETILKQQLPNE